MRIYDIAFYTAGFFILGVLGASAGLNLSIIILTNILAVSVLLLFGYLRKARQNFWLAGLSLLMMVGAFYYLGWVGNQIKNINIVFNEKINFQGIVVDYPERGSKQELTIKLESPYVGKALVKTPANPRFNYGDLISFEGTIKDPAPINYANYLAKEGIFGIVDYPQAELIAENQASFLKSKLLKLKEKILIVFQKSLASEKAAFLAGITLGERAEFSDEFEEAMSLSGTTHLVALSGYNISVIVITISILLGRFLKRRLTFILTTLVILGFVLMTGAEASVVRAAIMGFIALLAGQVGRLYSVRNAIILAAFFMILANPRVLVFDIGFQLSFAALLGIVYLSPVVRKFLHFDESAGFLFWRENFLTTFSAQLAVAPILILNFGNFSFVSLLANILILSVIPLTMSLGFILGAIGFISYYFSLVFGWFTSLFLSYEVLVIRFFGRLGFLQVNYLSGFLAVIYYFILIGFVFLHHFPMGRFKRKPIIES